MTPQIRIVPHNPEEKVFGDCHRTCYAIILDKKVEEVPHFNYDEPEPEVSGQRQLAYLKSLGLSLFRMAFAMDVKAVLELMEIYNPEAYWILGCGSIVANHSMVCKGGRIICDPNTGKEADPDNFFRDSIDCVWVEVFFPLKFTAES